MRLIAVLLTFLSLIPVPEASAFTVPPGRRVVALPLDAGRIFVSWRYRDSDGLQATYEVKRSDYMTGPFTMAGIFRHGEGTCFVDSATTAGKTYYCYVTSPAGISRTLKITAGVTAQPCISIPIPGDYAIQQLALGDLNGDFLFELVLLAKERSTTGTGSGFVVSSFNLEGECIWNTPVAVDISEGDKYLHTAVWDLDGDGKDEVLINTAKKDSAGTPLKFMTDKTIILEPSSGKVIPGEEFPDKIPALEGKEISPGVSPAAAQSLELSWDESEGRELATDGKISRHTDGEVLATYRGNLVCAADFLGDWREELITLDTNILRIYTTTLITTLRLPSPLDSLAQRIQIARGWFLADMISDN